ncbi:MAG: hypothetical protein WBV23_01340 [Desulfobaccales bacterium]
MMKDKSDTPPSFLKMEQARKLMDQGHHHESLVLALEVLLQELDSLRDSLLALQMATRSEYQTFTPDIPEEHPQPDHYWLPAVKPRVLH